MTISKYSDTDGGAPKNTAAFAEAVIDDRKTHRARGACLFWKEENPFCKIISDVVDSLRKESGCRQVAVFIDGKPWGSPLPQETIDFIRRIKVD